jgi:hypothetical protein
VALLNRVIRAFPGRSHVFSVAAVELQQYN